MYSFFLRYSEEFNYESEAVSVGSGGIVPKRTLPFATDGARFAAAAGRGRFGGSGSSDGASWNERLCVDCPLSGETCRGAGCRFSCPDQHLTALC